MLSKEFMTENIYADHWKIARAEAEAAGHEIIEHGWEQHVIIDHPNETVYRYPRHAAAAAKLNDEVGVLKAINALSWNIQLPVMQEHNAIYSSYRYVPGEVLLHEDAKHLTDEQCDQIGSQLGIFLAQLHGLDPSIAEQKVTKQTTTLFEYYAERIAGGSNTPFFDAANQRLQQLKATTDPTLQVIVHGDLHGPNIVVNDRKELTGVIDFSELEIGNPHQEFRKLFMTDTRLLKPAVEAYEQAGGQPLNAIEIVLWAYVNEWANMCNFADAPDNLTYQRAQEHLQLWNQL